MDRVKEELVAAWNKSRAWLDDHSHVRSALYGLLVGLLIALMWAGCSSDAQAGAMGALWTLAGGAQAMPQQQIMLPQAGADVLLDPINLVMVFTGLVMHFLKDMAKGNLAGQPITPRAYFLQHPYQSLASIVGTVAVYTVTGTVTLGDGQVLLNAASAFGAGWMGNSAADIIGERAPKPPR